MLSCVLRLVQPKEPRGGAVKDVTLLLLREKHCQPREMLVELSLEQ